MIQKCHYILVDIFILEFYRDGSVPNDEFSDVEYEVIVHLVFDWGEVVVFIAQENLEILVAKVINTVLETETATNQEIVLETGERPWVDTCLTECLLKLKEMEGVYGLLGR